MTLILLSLGFLFVVVWLTRKIRHRRRYISLAPATRPKGRFEWLFGPPDAERVLAKLPWTLRELDVSGLDIDRLPNPLPAGLIRLRARDCKQLRVIDHLPDSLINADLGGCDKLARLPKTLPAALEELCVSSTAITRLPKLPARVRSVDAYRCRNLMVTSTEWPRIGGDNLYWLNLRKSPALFWVAGNLPDDAQRQLREHGFVDYRRNGSYANNQASRGLWQPGPLSV